MTERNWEQIKPEESTRCTMPNSSSAALLIAVPKVTQTYRTFFKNRQTHQIYKKVQVYGNLKLFF